MNWASCGAKMPPMPIPITSAAFVRHEIVPRAKERNPRLLETLTRTMNLIAEEDDMLADQARELLLSRVRPLGQLPSEGFLVSPDMTHVERPLARRVIDRVLSLALGRDARIETASIETCLDGLGKSGLRVEHPGKFSGELQQEWPAN